MALTDLSLHVNLKIKSSQQTTVMDVNGSFTRNNMLKLSKFVALDIARHIWVDVVQAWAPSGISTTPLF